MHQRGESTDQKGRYPHTFPRFVEAPLMRLSVGTLRQVVKRDLPIAFVPQQLTSYGGLELVRRYLRQIDLPRRLHVACAALGGGYGGARLALLPLTLPYVGARRLEHLQYLVGDPLVRRFTGLARVPTARTVSNWLRRVTQESLGPLMRLQSGARARHGGSTARPAADTRCRRHCCEQRRHGRLGFPRLQSPITGSI